MGEKLFGLENVEYEDVLQVELERYLSEGPKAYLFRSVYHQKNLYMTCDFVAV